MRPNLARREALRLMMIAAAGFPVYGCDLRRMMTPKRSAAPPPENVNGCILEPTRLAALRECMECCGPESPADEWNHSCLHPLTVAYSCGRLAYPGGPNEHEHDPDEIARNRRLAKEAGAVCHGLHVNLSESISDLVPFYITANRQSPAPSGLTSEAVRSAFGGAIYPQAEIIVEPLEMGNRGWMQIADSEDGKLHLPPGAELRLAKDQVEALRKDTRVKWEEHVRRWRTVLEWFHAQEELLDSAFVVVGLGDQLSPTNFGCVFPRLVAGITKAGSLVGVWGCAVHT